MEEKGKGRAEEGSGKSNLASKNSASLMAFA